MHSYAHGLGGKHIWPILETYVIENGRDAIKKVDERYINYFFNVLKSSGLL